MRLVSHVIPVFALLELTCASGCITGPEAFATRPGYSMVEITETTSGGAVAGAEVSVGILNPNSANSVLPQKRVAPTDASGQTLVPYLVVPDRDAFLRILISHGDRTETVEILNVAGALELSNAFAVRVIDTDAHPQEIAPMMVEQSNPPTVSVRGIVVDVDVCSTRTGEVVWGITSDFSDSRGVYIDDVVVGTIPEGFGDVTRGQIFANGSFVEAVRMCSVSESGTGQLAEFTVVLRRSFESTPIATLDYCAGEEGQVVTCSAVR
jgi:hypothetical protein